MTAIKKIIFVHTILTCCLISFSTCVYGLTILTLQEPPGNFTDKNRNISGLSVEFVREIQKRLENTDSINMVTCPRFKYKLFNEPNVVGFSVARTPEREDKFHWIALMMRKPWTLYEKRGSGLQIKNLEDAKKVKSIGVARGDVRADYLKQKGFTNLEDVYEHELNIKKLLYGRVPLIFYSAHGASHICRKLDIDFNELNPVLTPNSSMSYIVMSKKGTSIEAVKEWKEIAQQIKDDGTFQKMAEKWMKYTIEKDGIECEIKDGALNFWKE